VRLMRSPKPSKLKVGMGALDRIVLLKRVFANKESF
jgi:hypothetical protein